jgi:DNA-binding transcriptional LysR family regulator
MSNQPSLRRRGSIVTSTPGPSLLGRLELLAAVVATGNFVRAGERIGLTQSGVSRAVARLEQSVGVRLFNRDARAVTLTDEGRRFHAQVSPLLAQLTDAVEAAAGAARRVRGRLRINVDAFFARAVLAPRIDRFLSAYPEIDLEIITRTGLLSQRGFDSAGTFSAEGFDAAVRFGEPQPSSVIARRLLSTRIITCAAPAYLARRGHPRHPRELAGEHEAILFIDPATNRPFDWDFHQGRKRLVRIAVHGRLLCNDVGTAVGACLAGYGVAQLMELGARELVDAGELVELFPRWHDELFPLYVFHPSRHLPPAKVRAFLDFVIESTRPGSTPPASSSLRRTP